MLVKILNKLKKNQGNEQPIKKVNKLKEQMEICRQELNDELQKLYTQKKEIEIKIVEIENEGAEMKDSITKTGIVSISKKEAKELCKKNNIFTTKNTTFASKNSTTQLYWANPNITCLSSNWWLLLNDYIKKELHIFYISANSIKENQLKYKNMEQIDLQIYYGDQSFEDSRSGIKFRNWLVKTILY